MKTIKPFTIIISIFCSAHMYSQTFQWAEAIGGGLDDFAYSTAIDFSGNVISVGTFRSTTDFDPGPGIFNLSTASSNDVFIQKLDGAKNFLWAKKIGGTADDQGYGVTTDPAGNIYITGSFIGTVDFDPGAGVHNLVSTGGSDDVFICKLDGSGNFVWASNFGSAASTERGIAITIDLSGNVLVTGWYANGSFIRKLNSSGTLVWFRTYSPGSGVINSNSIAVDQIGGVAIIGNYSTTIDFDPGAGVYNLTSTGYWDAFITKIDSSGNFMWAKGFGCFSFDDYGNSIAIDRANNVYGTGGFTGSTTFGSTTLSPVGQNDVYVTKLNSAGTFQWTKQMGGASGDVGYGISIDANSNVYSTGRFMGNGDFNPGAGVSSLISAGVNDIFVSKLDSNGVFISAFRMGGASEDYSYCINATTTTFCVAGYFYGTADFDGGAGTYNLTVNTTATNSDGFVVKYDNCISAPSQPASVIGSTAICSGSSNVYSVTPVPGATSYTWTLPGGWTGTSTTNSISATAGATSGNVTVTANNTCGNSAPQTLAVTVNTIPSTPGSIAGSSIICSGSTNTYSVTAVSGATSYTWTLPGGWTGTSTTNSITTTASATSGNITVTANNACGNSTPQTLAISVNTIPGTPGTITGTTVMCAGSGSHTYSITSVAGATSYTWTLPSGWTGTSTTNSINGTPGTSGNITVTADNTCGSSSVQTLAVTVNTLPNITATGGGSVCEGNSICLTGANGSTYSWNGPCGYSSTLASPCITPAITCGGTYTVTGTDVNGCSNTASTSITVNPTPTASYTQSPALVCVNATSVTLSPGSPAGGIYSGTSVTGSTFNASTAGVGTFPITYTYTNGSGCSDTAMSNIVVDPCTGIQQQTTDNQQLEIYPNPTTNFVTVIARSLATTRSHLSIFNVFGKKVFEMELIDNKAEINLGDFDKGIYFIQVQTGNRTFTKKIIKN
jgi:hypothetical protein